MKTLDELLKQIIEKSYKPESNEEPKSNLFDFSPSYGVEFFPEEAAPQENQVVKQKKSFSTKIPITPPPKIEDTTPLESLSLQSTPSRNLLETNELVRGFEEALKNKKALRDKEIFLNLLGGAVGLGAGIDSSKLRGLEITELEKEIAESPAQKAKLKLTGALQQTAVENALNKADPNSEVSKIYRENFAQLAKKLGLTSLASNLEKAKLSAQQVEDLTGQLNLNNLFNTQIAAENRLQNLMLRLVAQDEKQILKKEDEQLKKEESLRKFITNRSDLKDDRLNYSAAVELEDSLRDIANSLSSGNKIDTQAQSVNALFRSMKLIQGDKSVIREGEYKNIIGAFGSLENFERLIRQDILKYGAITPNMLRSLNHLARFYKKYTENKIYEKIKPDFKKVGDLNLDPQRVFDEDLQKIYQKGQLKEQLQNKKVIFKDGKFVVEE